MICTIAITYSSPFSNVLRKSKKYFVKNIQRTVTVTLVFKINACLLIFSMVWVLMFWLATVVNSQLTVQPGLSGATHGLMVEDVERYSAHCVVPVGVIRSLLQTQGPAVATPLPTASVRRKRSGGLCDDCLDTYAFAGCVPSEFGACCGCFPLDFCCW